MKPHVALMDEPAPVTAAGDVCVLAPASFTFDGHRFPQAAGAMSAPWLDLASRARRGDRLARELLEALRVAITDLDGRVYWPWPAPGGTPS